MKNKNLVKKLLPGTALVSAVIAVPFFFNDINLKNTKKEVKDPIKYEILNVHGTDYLGIENKNNFEFFEMGKLPGRSHKESSTQEFTGGYNSFEIHGQHYLDKEGKLTPVYDL